MSSPVEIIARQLQLPCSLEVKGMRRAEEEPLPRTSPTGADDLWRACADFGVHQSKLAGAQMLRQPSLGAVRRQGVGLRSHKRLRADLCLKRHDLSTQRQVESAVQTASCANVKDQRANWPRHSVQKPVVAPGSTPSESCVGRLPVVSHTRYSICVGSRPDS